MFFILSCLGRGWLGSSGTWNIPERLIPSLLNQFQQKSPIFQCHYVTMATRTNDDVDRCTSDFWIIRVTRIQADASPCTLHPFEHSTEPQICPLLFVLLMSGPPLSSQGCWVSLGCGCPIRRQQFLLSHWSHPPCCVHSVFHPSGWKSFVTNIWRRVLLLLRVLYLP
jgi:hypothetical protein